MKSLVILFVLIFSSLVFSCEEEVHQQYLENSCEDIIQEKVESICESAFLADYEEIEDEEFHRIRSDLYSLILASFQSIMDPNFIQTYGFNYPNLIKKGNFSKCREIGSKIDNFNSASPTELISFKNCLEPELQKINLALYRKLKKTKTWKNSRKFADQIYHQYLDQIEAMLGYDWYFQIKGLNNNSMNQVLSQMSEPVLSKSSARSVKSKTNDFLNMGVLLEEDDLDKGHFLVNLNAWYDDGVRFKKLPLGVATIYFKFFLPYKKVSAKPAFFYAIGDPSNELMARYIIGHEIAHAYTMKIKQEGLFSLSDDTLSAIHEKHNACIYPNAGDVPSKEIDEDLADFISTEIIRTTGQKFDAEQFDGLMSAFCFFDVEESDHGHAPRDKRAQRVLSHFPEFQNAYNCKFQNKSCSIRYVKR